MITAKDIQQAGLGRFVRDVKEITCPVCGSRNAVSFKYQIERYSLIDAYRKICFDCGFHLSSSHEVEAVMR